MTCLGIPGCVDKLHFWAPNNHKHDEWAGQVEGVDEVLRASNSGIYQSSNEPWSRTIRQTDVLSIPVQSDATSQRSKSMVGDNTLEQVCGTRRFARLAEESAKILEGANLFSKKELFAHDIQDFKRYLEESLYASVGVSGVTQVDESESKVGGQFFLCRLRGAHNMMAKLSMEQLERGVMCSSAGNQSQGVSLSAQQWGCNVVIVMPGTAPLMKRRSGEGLGVTIVIVRDLNGDAQFSPKEHAEEQGRLFISPFGRRPLLAGIVACEHWVIPEVNIFGVGPSDVNAMALPLHLDQEVELNQARGFIAKGAVMGLDEENFHLCSKELTEGMCLVSHSAICASIKNMFEEMWSILTLPLVGAEFVQLYWPLTSMGIELLEVFHGSQIFELDRLLVSWFPP